MPPPNPLSWIEISRSALLGNAELFRAQLGDGQTLMPVVKANAYGHGLELVGGMLAEAGYKWFGVFSAEELLQLASLPGLNSPKLLAFGSVPPAQTAAVVAAGGRLTLLDLLHLAELEATGADLDLTIPVHIEIETGLHRQGFTADELETLAERLAASAHVHAEGIYTHFANIEDTTDHSYARRQMESFANARDKLAKLGVVPEFVHASCSAAGILFPETHHDLLRLGISLYGHWPSRETKVSARTAGRSRLDLRQALTWKTRISQIKPVAAGGFVGYGCSWKAEADTRLGVIPVGYADGYDRGLGGAHVLISGRRAPIRGRVMMNHCLVDLCHIPNAKRGSEVVLIGRQGGEEVTAEMLAEWTGTINYEVLARLGSHLPRVATE